MNLGLSATNSGNSLLCSWDPRLKIVGLLALSFSFSFVSDLRILPVMVAVTIFFWAISSIPIRIILQKLRYPSLVILFLVFILPFAGGGTPLINLGFATMTQEGLASSLLIAARFYSILILAMVFLGTTHVLVNIRAIQALGLPYIMADMALLVVRYLEVLGQDLRRMHRSMLMRGHQNKKFSQKNLQTMAWLMGSLLLRSYERAEGVYKAMRLRGYGQTEGRSMEFSATFLDVMGLVAVIGVTTCLVWLETTL